MPSCRPDLAVRLPHPDRHLISGWRLRAVFCTATSRGDLKQERKRIGWVSSLVMEVNQPRKKVQETPL